MAISLNLQSPLLVLNLRSRSHPHILKAFSIPRFFPLNPPQFQIRSKILGRRGLGFRVHAVQNGGGEGKDEMEEARGQSTMPERFRYLNKEVPDRPVRWPWVIGKILSEKYWILDCFNAFDLGLNWNNVDFLKSTMPERFRYLNKEVPDRPVRWPWVIALVFLVYSWRTVLWELTNWKKAALAILHFFGYLLKLVLAFVFHFVGDSITGLIRSIEFSLYLIRYIYSNIIAFAPVPELTRIILFTSTILSIAEATFPDSVNSQPYLLTIAGVIVFGAVKGVILEPSFWLLFVGMFCYSRFIKKRDAVSATLPSAAALAAIGEPWMRGLTIASYLSLAIVQHSKSSKESASADVSVKHKRLPLPLLLVALAIGIHVAAKWIRYRHLTWMIA